GAHGLRQGRQDPDAAVRRLAPAPSVRSPSRRCGGRPCRGALPCVHEPLFGTVRRQMTANGEDMIGYLKGKVLDLTLESALIAVNGVGYEVFCSGAAFSKLARGNEGEVYTVMQVKEDGISLYGFADLKEKQLFLRLTSVQGVGAKMALSLLSAMRP